MPQDHRAARRDTEAPDYSSSLPKTCLPPHYRRLARHHFTNAMLTVLVRTPCDAMLKHHKAATLKHHKAAKPVARSIASWAHKQ
jgi:hypothetical protein